MNLVKHGLVTAVVPIGVLITSGCVTGPSESALSSSAEAQAESEKPTETPTPTPTPKPTRTPPADSDGDGVFDILDDFPEDPTRSKQLLYASGAPVLEGYPLIVDTAQLDFRLASWIKTPQAVALAPGVYVGYNPAVTDLAVYLESNVGDGDCAVRDLYQFGGGSCWDGVLASPAEPQP